MVPFSRRRGFHKNCARKLANLLWVDSSSRSSHRRERLISIITSHPEVEEIGLLAVY